MWGVIGLFLCALLHHKPLFATGAHQCKHASVIHTTWDADAHTLQQPISPKKEPTPLKNSGPMDKRSLCLALMKEKGISASKISRKTDIASRTIYAWLETNKSATRKGALFVDWLYDALSSEGNIDWRTCPRPNFYRKRGSFSMLLPPAQETLSLQKDRPSSPWPDNPPEEEEEALAEVPQTPPFIPYVPSVYRPQPTPTLLAPEDLSDQLHTTAATRLLLPLYMKAWCFHREKLDMLEQAQYFHRQNLDTLQQAILSLHRHQSDEPFLHNAPFPGSAPFPSPMPGPSASYRQPPPPTTQDPPPDTSETSFDSLLDNSLESIPSFSSAEPSRSSTPSLTSESLKTDPLGDSHNLVKRLHHHSALIMPPPKKAYKRRL
ncbi:hypothetical protein EIL50_02100 [bacterium NHP-B]|nr:hypothetical protein EIL50_02100 [bacterium NHP-B]